MPAAACSVTGSGFPANTDVRLNIGQVYAHTRADPQGRFEAPVLVTGACGRIEPVHARADSAPGIAAEADAEVRVVCQLAHTGPSDLLPLAYAGMALTGAGGALRFLGRYPARHAGRSRGRHALQPSRAWGSSTDPGTTAA